MADVIINGDAGGLRLSWPRVVTVVMFLLVFGVAVGKILANQETQKDETRQLRAEVRVLTDRVADLTVAVEVLKVPPRIDSKNRILKDE